MALAKNAGVQPHHMEKEYLQNIFLYSIFSKFEGYTFKGGTALKIAYGYTRFSDDLDFNSELSPEQIKEEVNETIVAYELLGISASFYKEELFENSYTARLVFEGPMYTGAHYSRNSIQLDIGKRIGTALKPARLIVYHNFPDLPQYHALCMQEKEILAEKVLALSSRKDPKDLYDIWGMLNKGLELDTKLINEKFGAGKPNNRKPKLPKFPTREEYGTLSQVVRVLPDYDIIVKEVKAALRSAGLLSGRKPKPNTQTKGK